MQNKLVNVMQESTHVALASYVYVRVCIYYVCTYVHSVENRTQLVPQLGTLTKKCQLSPRNLSEAPGSPTSFSRFFSLWPIVTSRQGVHIRAHVYLYII